MKDGSHRWVGQPRSDNEVWLPVHVSGTPSTSPGTGGTREIFAKLGLRQAYILLMLVLVSVNQHFANKSQSRCDL